VEGREVHLEFVVVLPARTQGWNRIWIRTDPGPFAGYGFPTGSGSLPVKLTGPVCHKNNGE
jgi:hypothetical protein